MHHSYIAYDITIIDTMQYRSNIKYIAYDIVIGFCMVCQTQCIAMMQDHMLYSTGICQELEPDEFANKIFKNMQQYTS